MKTLINNYENGNLKDARKQAKRHSQRNIRLALMDYGYSFEGATIIAEYLKTGENFNECVRYSSPGNPQPGDEI
jgi:predicted alpha/beta-fold hydrolase